MPLRFAIFWTLLFSTYAIVLAQDVSQDLKPYPLPPKSHDALLDLAAQCDVLILGECHGTQEVPRAVASLLPALTKSGYGILALEIPIDQQEPLKNWVAGNTTAVPHFFARPFTDGRGNAQTLSLIRTALSPPFNWQPICFDEEQKHFENDLREMEKALRGTNNGTISPLLLEKSAARSILRDATMARNLANDRSRLPPGQKVLAICGDFHARTSNQSKNETSSPSFAANLKNDHPAWRVRSLRIVPLSGGHFGITGSAHGFSEGIHKIQATREIDQLEAYPLKDDNWDWQLDLPHATPATFLATPIGIMARLANLDATQPSPSEASCSKNLPQPRATRSRCFLRRCLWRRSCRRH